MNLPKIQIGCSDDGSVYLPTLEVSASDVNRNKAAGASRVNGHAWPFNVEEVTDSVAQYRASDSDCD